MKTPRTIAPMKRPRNTKRLANGRSIRCFLGLRGGCDIMSFEVGSTPSARAGRMSVPTFTDRIRTAVRGAGRRAAIATKTVRSSPMLHENM